METVLSLGACSRRGGASGAGAGDGTDGVKYYLGGVRSLERQCVRDIHRLGEDKTKKGETNMKQMT